MQFNLCTFNLEICHDNSHFFVTPQSNNQKTVISFYFNMFQNNYKFPTHFSSYFLCSCHSYPSTSALHISLTRLKLRKVIHFYSYQIRFLLIESK
jgi:hypothetical protein